MKRTESPLPPPPSHVNLMISNLSDLSFHDNNAAQNANEGSPLPIFNSMNRINEKSANNQSPFRVVRNTVRTTDNPQLDSVNRDNICPSISPEYVYIPPPLIEPNNVYSPLAFTDDTMFTGPCSSSQARLTYDTSSSRQSSSSASSARNEKMIITILCQFCGQFHEKHSPHLYDYSETVDSNLLCNMCSQPLVDPLEANCGHTYCSQCLKNHLAVQAICPMDKIIINYLECKPASAIVRKLLDKLKVVCPNVDYCEEILFRNELHHHLKEKCRGAILPCINAKLGCSFQGARNSFSTHQWECKFKDLEEGQDPMANDEYNFKYSNEESTENCKEVEEISNKNCGKMSNQIIEGVPSEIEIKRVNQCDLGFSFVGGVDTPLGCVVIQEIYLDGIISQDRKLRPGDQLLEVNGFDLTSATHVEAKHALSMLTEKLKFLVLRETTPVVNEHETFTIRLLKRNDYQLGIVLDKKKNHEGIYIRNIIHASEAYNNGYLKKGDRILLINDIDIAESSQEDAARIIKEAINEVNLVVQRRLSVPDIVKQTDDRLSLGSWSTSSNGGGGFNRESNKMPQSDMVSRRQMSLTKTSIWSEHNNPRYKPSPEHQPWVRNHPDQCWTHPDTYQSLIMYNPLKPDTVQVRKQPHESLSITVAGGINSHRGDIPIYVTNIYPNGVLSRHRKVKKGTILLSINEFSLLNLTHKEAVDALKHECYGNAIVDLHILDGPETSSGASNFMPSWKYWLQLPLFCATHKSIELFKDNPHSSLGFSVVGGIDAITGPSQSLDFLSTCIMIKTILPGSLAFTNGKLKCGDILLEVSNTPLFNVSHADAVQCLKRAVNKVTLKVISWPGTIV